jgi:hypothetical protein
MMTLETSNRLRRNEKPTSARSFLLSSGFVCGHFCVMLRELFETFMALSLFFPRFMTRGGMRFYSRCFSIALSQLPAIFGMLFYS